MVANEARIRLGLDGAESVKGGLKGVRDGLNQLDSAVGNIGANVVRMGKDFLRAAADIKGIDFGQAAAKARELDDRIARFAVRGGKNVDELRKKFEELGLKTGVGTERMAAAAQQMDSMSLSGIDESTRMMAVLGEYAEDTGRSIEEMVGFGDTMFTKLGLPAQRVAVELDRLRAIAGDTKMSSGFLGLERTLQRLAPLLAKIQGGTSKASAEKAYLESRGYSPDVVNQFQEKLYQNLASTPEYVARKAMNAKRGANWTKRFGFVYDPKTGRKVMSRVGREAFLEYVNSRPTNAKTSWMGDEGLGEMISEVVKGRKSIEGIEERADYAADPNALDKAYYEEHPEEAPHEQRQRFRDLAEGRRKRREIARENAMNAVGREANESGDFVSGVWGEHHTARAVVDTIAPPVNMALAGMATLGRNFFDALGQKPVRMMDASRSLLEKSGVPGVASNQADALIRALDENTRATREDTGSGKRNAPMGSTREARSAP